jgi:hypothetical protein
LLRWGGKSFRKGRADRGQAIIDFAFSAAVITPGETRCVDVAWWCDAFGLIGAAFRELDWKVLIFFESAVPISPNAWYA